MNIDELLSYAIRHFGKNSISEPNDNSNLVAFSSPITKNWFALLDLDPKIGFFDKIKEIFKK